MAKESPLPRLPDFPTLRRYREAAGVFYGTADHKRKIEELLTLVEKLRGRVIAVDLEGTLVCRNLAATLETRNHFPDERALAFRVDRYDRLRRPFAQELLSALACSNPGSIIWTGANENDADKMLRSAQLVKPEGITIVGRQTYKARLAETDVMDRAARAYPSNSTLDTLNISDIKEGGVKIPRALGVDLLIDDHAQNDATVCETLFGLDESSKIVPCNSFSMKHIGEVQNHHTDEELLQVLRRL